MVEKARTPVVDLGRYSAKAVKRLKKGQDGKVTESVDDMLIMLGDRGAVPKDATAIVVVVKEKRKKTPLDALLGTRLF
jgi:hypothetical protein